MPGQYEYKVIPAPTKGKRAKGAKGSEGRFSHMLTELMNEMAEDGWEFQRAETLPSVERVGLTKTETQQHNLLVFRRTHPKYGAPQVVQPAPAPAPAIDPRSPEVAPQPVTDPQPAPVVAQDLGVQTRSEAHSDHAEAESSPRPTPAKPPLTASKGRGFDENDLPGILKDRGKHLRDS